MDRSSRSIVLWRLKVFRATEMISINSSLINRRVTKIISQNAVMSLCSIITCLKPSTIMHLKYYIYQFDRWPNAIKIKSFDDDDSNFAWFCSNDSITLLRNYKALFQERCFKLNTVLFLKHWSLFGWCENSIATKWAIETIIKLPLCRQQLSCVDGLPGVGSLILPVKSCKDQHNDRCNVQLAQTSNSSNCPYPIYKILLRNSKIWSRFQ